MVENTAHIETQDTMAYATIDVRYRMTVWLPGSYTSAISNMTGIAGYSRPYNRRTGVVGKGTLKTINRMAEPAFNVGIRVVTVRGARCLAGGQIAIVAGDTARRNSRMIKATVWLEREKTGGIVAVRAFASRLPMKIGLTDGLHTVMAFAAISKYFLMINHRNNRKSKRCMTALASISGSDMKAEFRRSASDVVVMTNHAIRR